MLRTSLLVGSARSLDLIGRTPRLFIKRGWPCDPDVLAVVIAAVSCIALGAHSQPMKRPAAASSIQGWPEGEQATAAEIVAGLDLRDLLKRDG